MTDRRTFIAGLALAPVAVAASGPAFAQTSAFDRALADYRLARAKLDLANASDVSDEAELSAICRATDRALEKLVDTPAELQRHVAIKLEAVLAEYEDCAIDYSLVERIARDARLILA